MSKETVEQKLIDEIKGGFEAWAKVIPRAKGKCEYCGRELVKDQYGYDTAHKDHLLPMKLYPELGDNSDNWVLSCYSCNIVKGTFNCLDKDESPEDMINQEQKRAELIERVKKEIKAKLEEREKHWKKVRDICAPSF